MPELIQQGGGYVWRFPGGRLLRPIGGGDPIDDLLNARLGGPGGGWTIKQGGDGRWYRVNASTGTVEPLNGIPGEQQKAGAPPNYRDLGNGFFQGPDGIYVYDYMDSNAPPGEPAQFGLRRATPEEYYGMLAQEQQASAKPRTSYSVSQSLSDPRALAIQEQNLALDVQKTQQQLQLAQQQQNFVEAKYQQDRLDGLMQRQEAIRFQREQMASQQAQQSAESEAQRRFQAGQGAANRQFQGGESAADRAARAAEFAASQELAKRSAALNEQRFGFEQQQAQQGFQRQRQQDQLAAAQQYAGLVSQVDPAALPAFYAAGGGNIGNAIASGADALSQNALAPAAQTLQAIEGFNRQPNPYTSYGGQQQQPAVPQQQWMGYSPEDKARIQNQINAQALNLLGAGARGGSAQIATPDDQMLRDQGINPLSNIVNAWGQNPDAIVGVGAGTAPGTIAIKPKQPGGIPALAQGGFTRSQNFIAGDPQQPGMPNAEMVRIMDPEHNARAYVTPIGQQGFQRVPHFAFGTSGDVQGIPDPNSLSGYRLPKPPFDPNAVHTLGSPPLTNPGYLGGDVRSTAYDGNVSGQQNTPIDPALQPFIEKVRQFRMSQNYPAPIEGGLYNVGFNRLAPSLQSRYAAGLQSRYGVPAQDVWAEQQRYRLSGFARPGSVGY